MEGWIWKNKSGLMQRCSWKMWIYGEAQLEIINVDWCKDADKCGLM